MLKIGPTEAERHQVVAALRKGATFEEATKEARKIIDPDWFDRNRDELEEMAADQPQKATKPQPQKATKPSRGGQE